jgi:hypothetical protein
MEYSVVYPEIAELLRAKAVYRERELPRDGWYILRTSTAHVRCMQDSRSISRTCDTLYTDVYCRALSR